MLTSRFARLAAAARPLPQLAPGPHAGGRRAAASRAGRGDKSWGEIAREAAALAQAAAGKLASSVFGAVDALVPKKPRARAPQAPLAPFGGGLLGGLLGAAARSLAGELDKAARASQSLQQEAAQRIQASSRVRERLGPVTVGPPISQSSASSSVNGRTTKQVSLVLPVLSPTGQLVAQAVVSYSEGAAGAGSTSVAVRMPGGDTLLLDGSDPGSQPAGDSSQGEVVDAEFRDL